MVHDPFDDPDMQHVSSPPMESGQRASSMPGWARVLRRTLIIAAVSAAGLAVIAVLSGWTSAYEFARAIAVGGAVVIAVGMLTGLGITSTPTQRSLMYPTVLAHRQVREEVMSPESKSSTLYGVMVPTIFAGALLLGAGILGMRLS